MLGAGGITGSEAATHKEPHPAKEGRERENKHTSWEQRKNKAGGDRDREAIFRWVVREDLSEEGICEQDSKTCRTETGENWRNSILVRGNSQQSCPEVVSCLLLGSRRIREASVHTLCTFSSDFIWST